MPESATDLRKRLRSAGLTNSAIDAAWPEWWTAEGEDSRSTRTELRYSLARRLGLSPKALLDEHVEFNRGQNAKFKHLTAETAEQQALLASFGSALGGLLVRATPPSDHELSADPHVLRNAILKQNPVVALNSLVAACWGLGIPVIQQRVFPMAAKAMHAMVVTSHGRFAILIGHDAKYPAQAAFTLAHEMGHIALGHLGDDDTIVDLDDIAKNDEKDAQEREANEYALTLLAGTPEPDITTSMTHYNSTVLATAVVQQGPPLGIEPGTLALCLAYKTGDWKKAMSALQQIYGGPMELWRYFNGTADGQLQWDAIGDEPADYLRRIMGAGD